MRGMFKTHPPCTAWADKLFEIELKMIMIAKLSFVNYM